MLGRRPLVRRQEVVVQGGVRARQGLRRRQVELLAVVGVEGCGLVVELRQSAHARFVSDHLSTLLLRLILDYRRGTAVMVGAEMSLSFGFVAAFMSTRPGPVCSGPIEDTLSLVGLRVGGVCWFPFLCSGIHLICISGFQRLCIVLYVYVSDASCVSLLFLVLVRFLFLHAYMSLVVCLYVTASSRSINTCVVSCALAYSIASHRI
jgi:hypothetical protein